MLQRVSFVVGESGQVKGLSDEIVHLQTSFFKISSSTGSTAVISSQNLPTSQMLPYCLDNLFTTVCSHMSNIYKG